MENQYMLVKYNLNGISAPVQNIRMLEHVPFNISIGGFMALWYIARTAIILMAACVVMLISVYVKKQNKVYIISLLLAPAGLLNGIAGYSSGLVVIGAVIVPIIIASVVSVFCTVKTYRIWTNKGRKNA